MNTRRIIFWVSFLIILALIIWGLAVAIQKSGNGSSVSLGSPAAVSATDHVQGSANAPVTVIEYSDFQCPACEAYYPMVTQLMTDASTTVRLVYRHFPLPQHPNAIPAAIASEAASKQGKFWDMYNLLFTNHADWTELAVPQPVFIGYAKQLGLNVSQFTTDLNDPALATIVQNDLQEGQTVGIDQTPTFFVNGKAIVNPQSYADFKTLIQAAATGSSH